MPREPPVTSATRPCSENRSLNMGPSGFVFRQLFETGRGSSQGKPLHRPRERGPLAHWRPGGVDETPHAIVNDAEWISASPIRIARLESPELAQAMLTPHRRGGI